MKIFLMINGLLPDGESKPPSIEKPKPAPSLTMLIESMSLAVEGKTIKITH